MKEGLRSTAARLGVGSTGSPLLQEGFRRVYDEVARQQDLILGSLSGGTDLCTSFVGPSLLLAVRVGVISRPCIGGKVEVSKVEAFDPAGRPLTGEIGGLVLASVTGVPVAIYGEIS
jgi:acetoacetyl-CoA synthetase